MSENQSILLLKLLIERLERLSADSYWARRASGLRGNIIKVIEAAESGTEIPTNRMEILIDHAFSLLRLAGEEIPDNKHSPAERGGL